MRFVSYMSPGFPESLFELFADVIDAELHFETETSGPPAGQDPFADGTFDLGWVCSTSFVDLALRSADPSVQLAGVAWVPDDPDSNGRPVYFGDVVVASGSKITTVEDLRGARVACNDTVSLSGHFALRLAIEALDEDPDSFADLTFTGGHHNSLDALIAGEVDAAVVDSVVRIGRARHDADVDALKIVERLGPWPVQPLVARSDLDPALVTAVRDALLDASTRPEFIEALQASALTKLVAVNRDHYASVRKALERRPGGPLT